MRKSDKKYAGEYMLNPSASKFSSDGVIYTGKWYHFVRDEKTVKRTKILFFILSIIEMGVFILGGLYDTTASFTPYVFIPFIIMFLPLALNIGCTASSLSFEKKITHKQYDKKIVAQKNYSYAATVLSAVTLTGNTVMYFVKKDVIFSKDIVFTLSVAIILILSVFSIKNYKNIDCSVEC